MGALEYSYQVAREITRRHAKSFYFASFALRREQRDACYAIYAFCRSADDAVDCSHWGAIQKVLDEYRYYIDALGMIDDDRFLPAWWRAWERTVEQYQIPRKYFYELIEGLAMDEGKVRLSDAAALKLYCYRVGSVVGLMLTHIYVKNPSGDLLAYAAALGEAMQLTNILRDVEEDWNRGRLYLPLNELAERGIDEKVFEKRRMTEQLRVYIKAKVEEARACYQKAEAGIRRLPGLRVQLAVWVMRLIYAEILEEIAKRDYDIFRGRVCVSLLRKCFLALRAWREQRRGGND